MPMKRFLSAENILGFLVGVGLVGFLFACAHFRKTPTTADSTNLNLIRFDPPIFDYGTVLQSETITNTFHLCNKSTNAMKIIASNTSCSCTAFIDGLIGSIIGPGECLAVPVEFKTGARTGPSSSFLTVSVESKGARQEAVAELKGIVSVDFSVEPASVDFGGIKPGQSSTRMVTFRPNAVKELSIIAAERLPSEYDVSIHNKVPGDSSGMSSIAITLHAPKIGHRQRLDDVIWIRTSSLRIPTVGISVSGFVNPDFEAVPEVIVIPSGLETGESHITIRSTRPSRIAHILSGTASQLRAPKTVQKIEPAANDFMAWDVQHTVDLPNSALASAENVTFELEVRKGADRIEVASVTIQIKHLGYK